MDSIAQQIKKIVSVRGTSLQWLAEKVGVSKVGFYKMIDNNSFKVETLQKVADVLEIPVTSFFAKADSEPEKLHLNKSSNDLPKVGDKTLDRLTLQDIAPTFQLLHEYMKYKKQIMEIIYKAKTDKAYRKDALIKDLERITNTLFSK